MCFILESQWQFRHFKDILSYQQIFNSKNIKSDFFQNCDLRWVGAAFDGRGASSNDWLLLKRVTKDMCSNRSPRKFRAGKSLNFDEDNDENEAIEDDDDKYKLIIN